MSSESGIRNTSAAATNASSMSPPGNVGLPPIERVAAALRDQYAIHRELGRGGTAIVFLATHLESGRRVALKLLRVELARAVGEARFRREIKIARELTHPNIVPLLDVGASDDQLYFTMPFVEGETLRARIAREQQLDVLVTIGIARDVARALDYAHSCEVVHRDIKPANILLGPDCAMVADFGIARLMTTGTGDTVTDSGVAIGTPEYMSPEQGTAADRVDARSDVYSLGCVVYEMLAGEPPFTGPTAQAIVARQCQEAPRSIRVIRSAVPLDLERAVERALAKVPADRFQSAGAFVDALESGIDSRTDIFGLARLSRGTRVLIASSLVALAGLGTFTAIRFREPSLDPNRIVVFPLHDAGASTAAVGEEVATFIGYRLGEARPLRWRDGWELLNSSQRSQHARIGAEESRALSLRDGAAFFIDGSIIRRSDSVTVVLRLISSAGDSIVRVEERSAPLSTASLHQLGLAAVQGLLPDLVAPGGRIDRSSLAARNAVSVANFLQGERAYRRMHFRAALPHYQAAVRADSAFALAAMRGAYTASWLSETSEGRQLVRAALRSRESLTPAQLMVTRGLAAYLDGAADSAVFHLRRALRVDSTVHAAWTLLGEVYSRLLPNEWAADSLARAALQRARHDDPDFAPTLLLLEEFALRDGDLSRAETLARELKFAGADTTHAQTRQIMHTCVRDGVTAVDWPAEAQRDHLAVLAAAKLLAGGATQSDCAATGFRAVLRIPTARYGTRFGAFIGLQAQLAATGRAAEAPSVLELEGVSSMDLRVPLLIVTTATSAFHRESRRFADSVAAHYPNSSTITLWLLSQYEAANRDSTRLNAIAQAVRRKADSSRSSQDDRLARSIEARRLLLRGDTSSAIAIFRTLRSSATRIEIGWYPWAALAPERMLLAQLLFSRGAFEEARQIATFIDATEPAPNPFYLRESLVLRADAADSLHQYGLRDRYRARLRRLSAHQSR